MGAERLAEFGSARRVRARRGRNRLDAAMLCGASERKKHSKREEMRSCARGYGIHLAEESRGESQNALPGPGRGQRGPARGGTLPCVFRGTNPKDQQEPSMSESESLELLHGAGMLASTPQQHVSLFFVSMGVSM